VKIDSLSIERLRSHVKTDLQGLANVVFFLGQNAAGKSTIVDAVSIALRGTCRGLNEAGAGVEHLVTNIGPMQETSCRVTLQTDLGVITRELPGQGVKSAVQAQIDGMFAGDRTVPLDLRVLTETPRFLEWPARDQQVWLQKVMTPRLPAGWAQGMMGDDFAFLEPLRLDWTDPATLDRAEKFTRERRAQLKNALEGVETVNLDQFPESWKKLTIPEAETQVANAERSLGALRQQVNAGSPDLDALQRMATLATDAMGQAATLHRAAQEEPEVDLKALKAKVKKAGESLERARDLLSTAKAEARGLAAVEGELETLKANDVSVCQACKRPLDTDSRRERIEQLEAAVAVGRAAAERERNLGPDIERLSKESAELGSALLKATGRMERIAKTKADCDRAEYAAGEASKIYDEAKAKALPQEERDALHARITKGEGIVAQMRSYISSRSAQEKLDRTLALSRRELAVAERLVEKLGPGGIRNEAPGSAFAQFQSEFQQIADSYGLAANLTLDPYALMVNGRPTSLLSSSERLMVGFAFQAAAARVTGVRWMAFDNADVLDDAHRRVLHQLLAGEIVDQVFVCATLKMPDDKFVVPKPIPNWQFYLVQAKDGVSNVRLIA
jgi:exonuclease SbcC